MRPLDAYKVDAFTDRPYAGNPAGVIPDATGLTAAQMQAVAREMNVSETAFVLPADVPDADLRLRFFTPAAEVPLCGHATVAAFHVLAETGRIEGPRTLRLQTEAGVLEVDVREDGRVFLESDPLDFAPSPLASAELARALGIAEADLLTDAPGPMLVRGKLFVPVRGLKPLESMRPDLAFVREATQRHGIQGIVPLSYETLSPDAMTHIRFFAPAIGIDEDPVTGTAHMALAGYLLKAGRLHPRCVFVGEQGHFCGRPGRVEVEVAGPAAAPRIRVGGRASTTLRGAMARP